MNVGNEFVEIDILLKVIIIYNNLFYVIFRIEFWWDNSWGLFK